MRKLNFEEQALVSKLIANSADPMSCFPIKILETVFQDSKVTFHNEEEPYFNFYVVEGKEDSVKETSKRFISKVLSAITLLASLKREGLVVELDMAKDCKVSYGDDVAYVSAGLTEVRVYVEAGLVAEQLVRFINSPVYVSDALKDLQANEYVTFEDSALAEAKAMTKKARTAVTLSFLAVLIAIACVALSAMGILGQKEETKEISLDALKLPLEAIQGTLENKVLPAVVDVKSEVAGVKTAIGELDAEPVNLGELQKSEGDSSKDDSKKKAKAKRKRK